MSEIKKSNKLLLQIHTGRKRMLLLLMVTEIMMLMMAMTMIMEIRMLDGPICECFTNPGHDYSQT